MYLDYSIELEKWKKEQYISFLEYKLLKYIFERFNIVIPPLKVLPIYYKFFIILLFTLLSVGGISLIFILGSNFFLNTDIQTTILIDVNHRILLLVWGITVIFLLLNLDENYILKDYFKKKCFRVSSLYNLLSISVHILIIFLIILLIIIGGYFFKSQFIIFIINSILLITIYEEFNQTFLFLSIKKWKIVNIDNVKFWVIEEEEIADGFKKVKLFSLKTEYSYFHGNKKYCSSQIYIDEPRDKKLFKSLSLFEINQWIENHKEIKSCYVNLDNPEESVLKKDVQVFSFLGKYIIIFGCFISIYIINSNVNFI